MKKNLLSFIGSISGVFSIFFLGAPYLAYKYSSSSYYSSSSETTKISIQSLLGIVDKGSSSSYYYSGSALTMGGFLLALSLFCAFATLIIVLTGILKKKNANDKALILSSVNAFTIFYLIKSLINTLIAETSSSYTYTLGWGIVIVLVLFLAFFVLSLIGFIMSTISDNKEAKEKSFDDIYKFKKLYDEGIITKEEFDEKKKELVL